MQSAGLNRNKNGRKREKLRKISIVKNLMNLPIQTHETTITHIVDTHRNMFFKQIYQHILALENTYLQQKHSNFSIKNK